MRIIITEKQLRDIFEDAKKEDMKKVINDLVNPELEIRPLVVDVDLKKKLQVSNLILEWEQYPKIPKTNNRYRYDKGKNTVGMEDHIHVFYGNTKNQLYAINRSGTPHDGSKAQLNKKEIEFFKNKGFNVPKDGILEWIELNADKEYYIYYPTPLILLD